MRKTTLIVIIILPLSFSLAQSGRYERVEDHFSALRDQPLEVMIDVDAGEVHIEPSSDPLGIDVYMRFSRGEFHARTDFDKTKNRLRITLDKDSWWRKSGFRDETHSRVNIRLPLGVDMYFDAEVKAGEADLDMSGLRIREFYFRNLAGEVDIRFEESNPVEMELLDVDAKVGEMRLIGLGNARFERADINGGIGEIDIDFSGDHLNESRAKVDLDIGEATVRLPEDAGVRMEIGGGLSFLSHKDIDSSLYRRGSAYYSEDFEDQDRRFLVRITPGLGELNVER